MNCSPWTRVCLCAALTLVATSLGLGGCVLPNDPAVLARSERWYRRTDPARYFEHERAHGRVYLIGFAKRVDGDESAVPGVSPRDPAFRVAQTWYIPAEPTPRAWYNERFETAARAFARRYNALVLAWLHEHPGEPLPTK